MPQKPLDLTHSELVRKNDTTAVWKIYYDVIVIPDHPIPSLKSD